MGGDLVNNTTKQLLVAAAIVSMMGVNGISTTALAKGKKKGFKCEGGNACKGKGGCKSDANQCKKGSNACKGEGFVMAKNEADCEKKKAKNAPAPEAAAPATGAPAGEAAPPAGGEAPKAQ